MSFRKYNILIAFSLVVVFAIAYFAFFPVTDAEFKAEIEANSSSADAVIIVPETSEEVVATAPKFSTPQAAYSYAYNIFKSSKGYASRTYQTVKAAGFTQSVIIDREINRVSGKALMATYSSGPKNFFDAVYQEGENTTYTHKNGSCDAGVYPSNMGSPNSMSTIDFVAMRGMKLGEFPYVVNSSTANFSMTKTASAYIVTVTFNDIASSCSDYIKQIKFSGESNVDPVISSLKIDFTIDMRTGFFIKQTLTEKYSIETELPVLGMKAINCTSTSTEKFTKMDYAVDVARPDFL